MAQGAKFPSHTATKPPRSVAPCIEVCYQPARFGRHPAGRVSIVEIRTEFSRPRARNGREYIEDFPRVASQGTGVSGLADRYATALFDLADERKSLDQVSEDLRQLRAMLNESAELRRLVRSPILSRVEQGRAIAAVGERSGLSPLTRSFLGLVAQNRRLFAVPAMIDAFLARLAARRGEITAEVVAAQTLTPAQLDAVNEQLRKAMGSKVAVEVRVDPALLGGLVVKVGSRMVDASLRSKLHRLQLAMKGA
jgi:F-type H+-transporting ATPase subunit delta